MTAMDAARLAWLTESRDVAVLYWPAEAAEAERLDRVGVPRLLLVDPAAKPPTSGSCLEEWLMLPASDVELQTRLANLAKRAASHPRPPAIDDFGHLTYRSGSLFLSRIDQRLAQALIENFGHVVAEAELIETVWSDGATNQVLRVHVSRLRQRLKPLGLTIKCARSAGYALAEDTRHEPHFSESS
jgi:two-component system OmpR family response regulator